MADTTPGWVEVRLIGPKADVKALARLITQGRDSAADSGTTGPRRDGKHMRAMTVRLRTEPAPEEADRG